MMLAALYMCVCVCVCVYGVLTYALQVNADSSVEVIFPVVATIDQGEIELTVSAITQIGRDEETATLTVEVKGRGVGVGVRSGWECFRVR